MSPTAVLDRIATIEAVGEGWYAEVERAGQLMSTRRRVPPDVSALVDALAERLGGEPVQTFFAATDPYLAQMLLAAALACTHAVTRRGELAAAELRLGLERLRQALRDVLDERPAGADRPPKELSRWLLTQLSVPQAQLAGLLGVSVRTLQRWVSESDETGPDGEELTRLHAVASVTSHLRHVFTGPGAARWFDREHPQLLGERPADLIDDPLRLPELLALASQSRSTMAS